MSEQHGVSFIQHAAAAISRRGSLLTLGAAALTAPLAASSLVEAKKGKNTKKKARQKCKQQVDACLDAFTPVCQGNPTCQEFLLPCCSPLADCSAGPAIDCVLDWFGQ